MHAMTRDQFEQHEQVPTDFLTLDQRTHLAGLDTNRFAHDARLHVRFFTKPTMNALRSEAAQRPIYEELEYIEIWIPGDKTNINVRPVQLDDKMRFAARYKEWKSGIVVQRGTPLKLLPFLNEAQVEELAYFKIATVEQLAGVADSNMQGMTGLQGMKQQAISYIASQSESSVLLARIAALEALVQVQAQAPETAAVAPPVQPPAKGKTAASPLQS